MAKTGRPPLNGNTPMTRKEILRRANAKRQLTMGRLRAGHEAILLKAKTLKEAKTISAQALRKEE